MSPEENDVLERQCKTAKAPLDGLGLMSMILLNMRCSINSVLSDFRTSSLIEDKDHRDVSKQKWFQERTKKNVLLLVRFKKKQNKDFYFICSS